MVTDHGGHQQEYESPSTTTTRPGGGHSHAMGCYCASALMSLWRRPWKVGKKKKKRERGYLSGLSGSVDVHTKRLTNAGMSGRSRVSAYWRHRFVGTYSCWVPVGPLGRLLHTPNKNTFVTRPARGAADKCRGHPFCSASPQEGANCERVCVFEARSCKQWFGPSKGERMSEFSFRNDANWFGEREKKKKKKKDGHKW